jgi:hypothetical protein
VPPLLDEIVNVMVTVPVVVGLNTPLIVQEEPAVNDEPQLPLVPGKWVWSGSVMFKPWSVAVPVLLIVMGPCALVEPTETFPKLMEVGDTVRIATGPMPAPVRETSDPVTTAPPLYATVKVLLKVATVVGANRTLMVHEALTASAAPQLGAPAGNVPVETWVYG